MERPSELDPSLREEWHRRLGAWYQTEGRDLPWRRTSDPYAIWISEAMLQQTRVQTVIDYWTRFLARFPTVADLAEAPEDEVLGAWSGLGYYRRARSLQAAARVLVERHGARFPRTRREAEDLPGVGPYTAGAVLSIAFDLPEALVDGNVARVFARLFDLDLPGPALDRAAWSLARDLVPQRAAGAWNQALMELGATLCTPREPRCGECPLAGSCRSLEAGVVADRPRPKVRPQPIAVELELAVIRRGDEVLLERRPRGGRMAGLWQVPTREVTETGLFPGEWTGGVALDPPPRELGRLRHSITRHRIRAAVLEGSLQGEAREGQAWFALGELEGGSRGNGLTGMTKKTLALLR